MCAYVMLFKMLGFSLPHRNASVVDMVSYLERMREVVIDYEDVVDIELYAVVRSNSEYVYSTYGWSEVCFIYGSKSLSKTESVPWKNCKSFSKQGIKCKNEDSRLVVLISMDHAFRQDATFFFFFFSPLGLTFTALEDIFHYCHVLWSFHAKVRKCIQVVVEIVVLGVPSQLWLIG